MIAVLDQQYAQLIQHAVGLLPSQQKQIFQMAKVEGLSHKDIAAQLKISHLTVKTHMAKALRTIRHYLQPHLSSYLLYAFLICYWNFILRYPGMTLSLISIV